MSAPIRIALIHALQHSIAPSEVAFAQLWPEARLANLLDDSLSADLARAGEIGEAMTERFIDLGRYARQSGCDGILFTCSAFGPCIEACAAELAPMPVLKPNEAMIEEAVALAGDGGTIGLIATFPPTLNTMPTEFPSNVKVVTRLADTALAALDRGDGEAHDEAAATASLGLACDLIALSQFSLARAAAHVATASGLRVLTTPGSAVRKLQRLLR